MKKFIPIIATILFLALPLISQAHGGQLKGKYTKEKMIKKEFEVNANALMSIDNSYGNLNITSWNENRILIEIRIKTNGNNEEKVQKKLDEISVDFEYDRSMVSAKTLFNKNNNNWNWNWGGSNNVNMQIDYFIKVPVKNNVHLNNDYGSIILDRIDGHAKISCDYGRLEIGELRGRNNELNFDYTSKSSIDYINSGRITADYSGFTIDKAGDLVIKADYTNSTVLKMDNLQYSSDYGSIDISEANNVQGNGDYINVKLGTIHGNVDISADYGSLKINELAADAGNVQIRSDYMGITIGYHPQYYFDFEITAEYAGVSGKDNFEVNKSTEKSNQKYYKGYYGKSNSGNMVSVSTEYGSISFKKN
ncbi:hypothetical protein [Sediminicola sp. 1XM1-17]|uniref:hypothetical protein n=1 Tax=Sediminicola sp. 1XM1-17 TaxID=3127702 RepID=UPI003077F427